MPVQHTDAKISINGFLVLATKKETSRYGMFREVNPVVQNSNHFLADLKLLSEL